MSLIGISVRLRYVCYASNLSYTQQIPVPFLKLRSSPAKPGVLSENRCRSRSACYSPRLFHTLHKRDTGIDVSKFLARSLAKISQSGRKHVTITVTNVSLNFSRAQGIQAQQSLQKAQSHPCHVSLARFCSTSARVNDGTCRRSSAMMSAFPVVPIHDFQGRNNTRASGGKDVNLGQLIMRNFATSFQDHGRHRTYSVASSRSGIFDSQSWKRNEEEVNNQQAFGNASLMQQKVKNNVNHRMSNIKIHILDQNKNIKEKISIHRSKGVKAVRKLRRKLQTQEKEDIRTIPNLLTTLRMASAPVLGCLVVNDYFGCALSIFVLAGFTDLLDGYIARNFKNQRTALGTALDPLADKLLMCCLTLSLTSAGLIPVPLTVLILSRDAGLILASFVIRYKSLSPPRTLSRYFDVTHVTAKLFPSTISKINTGLQLSYVACVLASPVFGFVDHPLLQALMYTTAATTFLSGLDYVITWRRRLKIVKNK